MKSTRLLMVVFSLLVVAIAYVGPFSWLQRQANTATEEASTLQEQNDALAPKIKNAEKARKDEAAYNARLESIRKVLPELPEDLASPLVRLIADSATTRSVFVEEQEQGTSPLPVPAKPGETATAQTDANGNPIDAGQPKTYPVELKVVGSVNNIVDFVGDLSASERLFVYKVEFEGPGTEGATAGFSTDLTDPANVAKATIGFRAYAGPNASATATPPGK